ncbi:hypothetical protein V1292_002363 [Bradyrhizobium sp. AZCC 1719]|uniref:hypothetical protein n=1 Tax=Bradyrhizobium sp. AZCC 1719 TaxID=3117028 RepID=UPI002FEFDE5F
MAIPMPNCLPTVVPYGADQTVYLVFDSFGASRSDWPEKQIERDDLETTISDLLTGQFNAPVRVMAFNTLDHWIEDVSNQVAEDIQACCDIDGVPVPEHVRDFVASHTGLGKRGADVKLDFNWNRKAVATPTRHRAFMSHTDHVRNQNPAFFFVRQQTAVINSI